MRLPNQFARLRLHRVMLVIVTIAAIVPASPLFAQQSDPKAPVQVPTALASDTSTLTDPPPVDDTPESMFPHFKDTRFWLSGQANFVFQAHPEFPALYSGTHSLGPNYEKATSRVLTLYTGVRLNNSTELLVDIEEAGGAALSPGFGLAGNTDLDIVRNPSLSKAPYIGRAMIHKVFALSKDKVENQRSFLLPLRRTSAPPPRTPLRQVQHARLLRSQLRRLRYPLPIS